MFNIREVGLFHNVINSATTALLLRMEIDTIVIIITTITHNFIHQSGSTE